MHDALQLIEEPAVNLRQLVYLVYSVASSKRLANSEDARISRSPKSTL